MNIVAKFLQRSEKSAESYAKLARKSCVSLLERARGAPVSRVDVFVHLLDVFGVGDDPKFWGELKARVPSPGNPFEHGDDA